MDLHYKQYFLPHHNLHCFSFFQFLFLGRLYKKTTFATLKLPKWEKTKYQQLPIWQLFGQEFITSEGKM